MIARVRRRLAMSMALAVGDGNGYHGVTMPTYIVHPDDARETRALSKLVTITQRAEQSPLNDRRSFSVSYAGIRLGTVMESTETIERRPRGARIVTRRWERKCWRCEPAKDHRTGFGRVNWYDSANAHPSRIQAVAALVNYCAEDGGVLAPYKSAIVGAIAALAKA